MSALKSQVFTTSGTFTVPATVSSILLSMQAPGGGGAAGSGTAAGAGGSGEMAFNVPLKVIPGDAMSIIIGAGGTGQTVGGNNGGDGGLCSCGAFQVTGALGGLGGNFNPSLNPLPGKGGGANGGLRNGDGVTDCTRPVGLSGTRDGAKFFGGSGGGVGGNGGAACGGTGGGCDGYTGGVGGLPDGVFRAGGGGGAATIFGSGGHGGDAPAGPGLSATAAGAGGGGGGGTNSSANHGGDGAGGWVMLQWVE